ncbi:MAG: hypothetical protein M1838_002137 [Thelocarpon superellum]|nr:MAG: hypothetical protein M1838_002137 [Thelocarpon superellum]
MVNKEPLPVKEKPLNREPPLAELVSSFYTESCGYDRNHGPIPRIDPERHRVVVDGDVHRKLSLSVAQLQHDFPQHEVSCALQCAGNRRHTMRTLLKEVDGLDWGDGAVMNCTWGGPRLRDVLLQAGIALSEPSKAHVAFACYQTYCQDDDYYGVSIELPRALRVEAEVVLALQMNGKTITPNHGYPVRVIAPGVAGARSVKWLDRITVQRSESSNFYQQRDYKILPAEATDRQKAKQYWHTVPSVQDMPINSAVAVPACGETVTLSPEGTTIVRGYALPGGADGPIQRVEVSVDDGRTWRDAEIVDGKDGRGKWCWALWRAEVTLPRAEPGRILSRATDRAGNTQAAGPQWNLRGVCYNGYGEARDLVVV